MKKLNIAELLRDCPSDMELDSTIVGGLYFDKVTENNMIKCYTKRYYEPTSTCNSIYFYSDGSYLNHTKAKCVIFPKGKTTWEGFVPPCKFKDGDIITSVKDSNPFIFHYDNGEFYDVHCALINDYLQIYKRKNNWVSNRREFRYATEEEKQKLFDAIKANGYKWNPETKTLEKLIVPKFKVGDKIKNKYIHKYDYAVQYTIRKVYPECYKTDCGVLPFENQDDYELLPNKFDISSLKPFDKVLVRNANGHIWTAGFFSHIINPTQRMPITFVSAGGYPSNHCIPYEGNQHLSGTRNDCDEYYKTWK